MKVLKALTQNLKKKIFKISELGYIKSMTPLKELLEGEEMIDPIEIIRYEVSDKPKLGASGIPYIQKEFKVKRGSQRIQAALQLGYTHIEGIIINE